MECRHITCSNLLGDDLILGNGRKREKKIPNNMIPSSVYSCLWQISHTDVHIRDVCLINIIIDTNDYGFAKITIYTEQ